MKNYRMKLIKTLLFSLIYFLSELTLAQNKTDVSLFLKQDSTVYLNEVYSKTGDMFNYLGHHGPAIENEWLGLRIYFDKRTSIDIYSKTKPGLELREARWYPTSQQQKDGWGADYYKVGETVGLGGIRLWTGNKIIKLDPVSSRYARVQRQGSISFMELFSKNVPYKNNKIDILLRVTVFSGVRHAKVEVFALSNIEVQFATGVNYHKGNQLILDNEFVLTWGIHPEDVASEQAEVGSAIIFDPNDFMHRIKDSEQYLLISKPTKYLEYWITSCNSKELNTNTLSKFKNYVIELTKETNYYTSSHR